jgi:hypothetical protein
MMMLTVASVMAQDDKPNVVVAEFVNKSNVGSVPNNNLRQEIVSGLMETGRMTVVEQSTLGQMPKAKNELLLKLSEMGIQYYIEGTFNSADRKSRTLSSSTYYECDISYTLTIIETETGITKSSETLKESYSSGSTSDEALLKAIAKARKQMTRFVDNNFKVDAIIKGLDEVDGKKGVKTCYINIGSNTGMTKGQICEVFCEKEVVGEKIESKIGELKIEEVLSGTLSKCSVKSGGVEMKRCFDEQRVMTVRTRAKKESVFDKANKLLE